MCQALIPGATPACQLRKDLHNASDFSKIPSTHKVAADTNSLLKMDTWPTAQAKVALKVLDLYRNHLYLLTDN